MVRGGAATTARPGHTLLELVMAAALMALALVPALGLMQDALDINEEIMSQQMINTLCISKLEEQLALAAASFTEATASGSFSGDGYSSLRYTTSRSTDEVDGGVPDELMVVSATVWEDADADTVLDSDEPQATFSSKVAKMALYAEEVGGG